MRGSLCIIQKDAEEEEKEEEEEEEEEEEISPVDLTLGISLLGAVTLVMTLFKLANHEDQDSGVGQILGTALGDTCHGYTFEYLGVLSIVLPSENRAGIFKIHEKF